MNSKDKDIIDGLKDGDHRVIDIRKRILPNKDKEVVIIVEANYLDKIMLIANIIVFTPDEMLQVSNQLYTLNQEWQGGINKHPYTKDYFEAVDQKNWYLPWDTHYPESKFPFYSAWYDALRKKLLDWVQSPEGKGFAIKKNLSAGTKETFGELIDEL
jgi:hypothetical protein